MLCIPSSCSMGTNFSGFYVLLNESVTTLRTHYLSESHSFSVCRHLASHICKFHAMHRLPTFESSSCPCQKVPRSPSVLSLGMAWTHFASRSHMFSVGKELAPRDSNCLSMLAWAALCLRTTESWEVLPLTCGASWP